MILSDFLLVKDSGISYLEIDFNEDVQVVIGSNGSGKTSCVRQLSLYPPVRSLFGKKGYKQLKIENSGQDYILESQFEKPSSPHFFKNSDEENLNTSGTTENQADLIEEYFGITPFIDDLIMNRPLFPKWGNAKRKEFLMEHNPDDIGFVLPLIKKMSSDIKACKNNLARLVSRKILLEQDLLNEETFTSLETEKKDIDIILSHLQNYLLNIEVYQRGLTIDSPIVKITDISILHSHVKECYYKLNSLSHINRNDRLRQEDKEKLLSNLAKCDQKIYDTQNALHEETQKLNDLETQYKELVVDESLSQIDLTIEQLTKEQEKFKGIKPLFELSQEELEIKRQELSLLHDHLAIFQTRSVPLLPAKKRQYRERLLSLYQYKQTSYHNRLNDLQNQLEDLSKRHHLSPQDIPDKPCAKNACPLYAHFMGEYQHFEERRQKLQASLDKGLHKTKRLDRYVEALNHYLTLSAPYHQEIQWFISYAQTNPILHRILRSLDILTTLSTQPNRIIVKLQEAYDQIEAWLKYKSIEHDLQIAYTLKNRHISSESYDTIKLVSTIEFTKKRLSELREALNTLSSEKSVLHHQFLEIDQFNHLKDIILKIKQDHDQTLLSLDNKGKEEQLFFIKQKIEEIRSAYFLRMSEIERTLKSQQSLKDRYEEEIIKQITVIEKELKDLQQIEKALMSLAKDTMIDFINDVIDQTNRFLEVVWTIPLKVDRLLADDILDYSFNVTGDNHSTRELKDCSEGQTEIISLCFNLALRVILGHLNYPLCLDEPGRTFDKTHRQNLIALLKRLLNDKIISQLFIISHDAIIHESFSQSETLVLRDENIVLPEVYNKHAKIL